MDTNEVMRAMVDSAGMSRRAASLAMGRSDNWLRNTLARPGSSTADSVALLADVCGWSLCVVPSDSVPPGALVIDPPAR